jgi:hypothetical protein
MFKTTRLLLSATNPFLADLIAALGRKTHKNNN